MHKKTTGNGVSRRTFVKGAGVLGLAGLAAPFVTGPMRQVKGNLWEDTPHGLGSDFQAYGAENTIYTTCQQCNTHCSIRAIVAETNEDSPFVSLVRKIGGNPYSPLASVPYGQIDYSTPPQEAVKGNGNLEEEGRSGRGGKTCLKGQSGIQSLYDAYRVTQPLKRVGPRGSGKWKTISWDEALQEIVFGSPDLGTPGLKDLWAYVPEEEVKEDWDKVKNGEMSQEEFDAKYKDVLIDTKHPDFGPKANQIACMGGYREEFMKIRVWDQGFGSVNMEDHGGICGITSVVGNVNSFSFGRKTRTYADLDHVDFMLVFGTNPITANRGPTWLTPRITNALSRGMKMAVIDSRLSKTGEKADYWVPVIPGTDGALALAIGRWIVENKRYDTRYLRNPNKAAAEADGEPTWSDATHLVNLSDETRPKLRAADLGLGSSEQFVVMVNGRPVAADDAEEGDLEVDTVINGIRVKSAFTLYKEEVMSKSMDEYAEITGVSKDLIIQLAKEFTSYGKRAVAWAYRGPAMHTNGYYNTRALNILNHLIGNYDWKGGSLSSGARYEPFRGSRYDLLTVPGGLKPWGLPITRKRSVYETSSLFAKDGYPAPRPWFPVAGKSSQDLIPSAGAGYPYSLTALFIYRMNPILSMPAGHKNIEILKDPAKIPLLVSLDIAIGEGSHYADFILPDLAYLERWGYEDIYPNQPLRVTNVSQPVSRVVPEARAVEDVFIDILKLMELPGVGAGAFIDGGSLDGYEDFYLRMVANIAYDIEPVPDADAREMELFMKARQKALGQYFNPERLKRAVKPEEWPKVVYVLNRGGRFEAPGDEYEGELLKYRLGAQANFYDELAARGRSSYDGSYFSGIPKAVPITGYNGKVYDNSYPLIMTSWKAKNMGTHRSIGAPWLREVRGTNPIWIHPSDAKARGLANGDKVVIESDSFKANGIVMVTEGIRPGVVGSSYNFGHFAHGAQAIEIDGVVLPPSPSYGHTPFEFSKPLQETRQYAGGRGAGFSANDMLSIDPSIGDTAMCDLIGGGAAQLYTRVEIRKA